MSALTDLQVELFAEKHKNKILNEILSHVVHKFGVNGVLNLSAKELLAAPNKTVAIKPGSERVFVTLSENEEEELLDKSNTSNAMRKNLNEEQMKKLTNHVVNKISETVIDYMVKEIAR